MSQDPQIHNLVGGRRRELGRREADLAVLDVPHVVEALEEGHAVDEVEALAAVGAEVGRDEVHAVLVAADRGVELAIAHRQLQPQQRVGKAAKNAPRGARSARWA